MTGDERLATAGHPPAAGPAATDAQHARPGRAPSRAHRVVFGAVGVFGELLITLGVLLFAFLAWQLWWTDVVGNRAQAKVVEQLVREPVPTPTATAPDGTPQVKIATPRHDAPPVEKAPGHAVTFATIQVPRWDGEPERPISEGIDRATVLNPKGVGHYPGTAMPGGRGNFAIAGHRTTYAKPFNRIAELKVGDALVIRTSDTWYVYTVTSHEIVYPDDVGVIAPVPDHPGEEPTIRSITMTSCTPMYSAKQRYVVHGELAYWAPVSSGTPAELVPGGTAPTPTMPAPTHTGGA